MAHYNNFVSFTWVQATYRFDSPFYDKIILRLIQKMMFRILKAKEIEQRRKCRA